MPTKSKLVYLPPAQHDFEEIVKYSYYGGGDSLRAENLQYNENGHKPSARFPADGPAHLDPILAANGYRKLVLTKTYVAVYKVIGGTVYIYAIVNGATDYPRLLK